MLRVKLTDWTYILAKPQRGTARGNFQGHHRRHLVTTDYGGRPGAVRRRAGRRPGHLQGGCRPRPAPRRRLRPGRVRQRLPNRS